MASHPGEMRSVESPLDPEPELRLLVELEPRGKAFFQNIGHSIRRPQQVWTSSPPAKFWTDVFVPSGLPWGRIAESGLLHVLAVVAAISVGNAVSLLLPRAPQVRLSDKIYHYDLSYYLPPLDTGSPPAPKERKGQPLLAKQKIVSLPPRPDNFEQTVISPVDVKLPTNIKLPNIVAWTETPGVPSAAVTRETAHLTLPHVPTDVIAPAPDPLTRDISQMRAPGSPTRIIEPPPDPRDLRSTRRLEASANIIEPPPDAKFNPRTITAPSPSVIEPPPAANLANHIGQMNVGQLTATVAAPKLPVAEQKVITLQPGRAAAARPGQPGSASGGAPANPPIAPVGGIKAGPNSGQLIALNLHPAVPNGPILVPPGRRSGEFAAGPEGTPNAPGTPEIKGGGTGAGGAGTGKAGAGTGGTNGLPTGITVGKVEGAPPPGSVVVAGDPANSPSHDLAKNKETVMAAARPPRIGEIPRTAGSSVNTPNSPKALESKVFGGKQTYTLALNTPNLTSTGGSWIIRFAQLEDDHSPTPLSAPVAMHTVDPAYPADLVREGYEGTVILYAVIHKDGSVGEVRVLRSLQVRLDENARLALLRWKFRPGTKNGQAVELEAVVQIPFKASRLPY